MAAPVLGGFRELGIFWSENFHIDHLANLLFCFPFVFLLFCTYFTSFVYTHVAIELATRTGLRASLSMNTE